MRRGAWFVALIFVIANVAAANDDAARGRAPTKAKAVGEKAFTTTGLARVVETRTSPVARPAGLGWDGSSFWVVSNEVAAIYKIDPATMGILSSMPTPEADFGFGLDHDGTSLWGDVYLPPRIYQLDDTTGAVLNSFDSPYTSPNGVVFDGVNVWHSAFVEDLALMNPTTGNLIRTIPAPGRSSPRGLELYDGSLWVVDANIYVEDAIYRLNPADGTVQASYQPLGADFGLIFGIVHDGSDFWITDLLNAVFYRIELDDSLLFFNGFEGGDGLAWSSSGLDCGTTETAPGGACPTACNGGCPSAGTCAIACSGVEACSFTRLECPPGFDCEVTCDGTDACHGLDVQCPEDTACSITCAGYNSCREIRVYCTWLGSCDLGCGPDQYSCHAAELLCGHNSCEATCAGDSFPTVECGGSCGCQSCQ